MSSLFETAPTEPTNGSSTARLAEFQADDGKSIACVSRGDARHVYGQVFRDEVYGQHGLRYPEGGTYVDVGANVGMFLRYAAQRAPGLRYFGFEPIPAIFAALQANASRTGEDGLRLFNAGVSHEPGEAEFSFLPRTPCCSTQSDRLDAPDSDRAIGFAEERIVGAVPAPLGVGFRRLPGPARRWIAERVNRWYGHAEQVRCPLTTLSQLIDTERIDRIDLLKIDAEGAEIDALRGLRAEHWPLVQQAVIEVHASHGGQAYREVCDLLEAGGLRIADDPNPQYDETRIVFGLRD